MLSALSLSCTPSKCEVTFIQTLHEKFLPLLKYHSKDFTPYGMHSSTPNHALESNSNATIIPVDQYFLHFFITACLLNLQQAENKLGL